MYKSRAIRSLRPPPHRLASIRSVSSSASSPSASNERTTGLGNDSQSPVGDVEDAEKAAKAPQGEREARSEASSASSASTPVTSNDQDEPLASSPNTREVDNERTIEPGAHGTQLIARKVEESIKERPLFGRYAVVEDEALRTGLEQWGLDVSQVRALLLPHRTLDSVLRRVKALSITMEWTAKEDEALRKGRTELRKDASIRSQLLPHRSVREIGARAAALGIVGPTVTKQPTAKSSAAEPTSWTAAEDDLLRKGYLDQQLTKKQLIANHLPLKTVQDIVARLKQLGIKREAVKELGGKKKVVARERWTPDEDARLRNAREVEGLSFGQIGMVYFKDKGETSCRRRYERIKAAKTDDEAATVGKKGDGECTEGKEDVGVAGQKDDGESGKKGDEDAMKKDGEVEK
ncbi:hypothetical protein HK101_009539 [Irineochytrium annulatum]|nr:hypothetical protein HK101_009539 [Irineochytrium annulatum]